MTRDASGWDETTDCLQGNEPTGGNKRWLHLLTKPRPSVAAGCVLLAAVVVAGGWSGLLLVAAGHVVPAWALSGALLVAPQIPGLARRFVRRWAYESDDAGRNVRRPWVLTLLTVLAGVGTVLGAVGDATATYHVLAPNGPGGCRAAVRESSFLFSGNGDVYAVGAIGIGWRVSSWTADDGYTPVASGTYELTWGTDSGVLIVGGRGVDPVWPALHEVDCG
ncbi:hypothetical protein ABT346_30095 [Micromonospora peucetia]|uniref:hypothetical protein n=1 Tax=Micromonospora peucetia TaxID=47871 RepID=UPI0033206AE4